MILERLLIGITMNKTFSTLIGSSVLAAGLAVGSTVLSPAQAAIIACESPSPANNVTGTSSCQRSTTANQDFLNTTPITVNQDGGFFGLTNWSFLEKQNIGGSYESSSPLTLSITGTTTAQSGSWSISGDTSLYSNLMLIFKDGGDTFIVGYKLNATSGTFTSPFTEPPFNFPGNGPRDISHISLYGTPGEAIPEPLTILGAGTALGFGTFFKKRLAKANKKA